MRHRLLIAGGMAAMSATIMACGGSDAAVSPTNPTSTIATGTTAATTPATSPAPTTAGVQAMYAQFGNGVVVSYDGSTVVLQTTDVPDHPSPYFGAGHAQYEPPHSGMQPNSNRIVAQNLTFRVPAAPSDASRWKLVTGDVEQIYRLARTSYFADDGRLSAERPATDQFLHTEKAVLVDRHGRLRGVYNATLPHEIDKLMTDLGVLLQSEGP